MSKLCKYEKDMKICKVWKVCKMQNMQNQTHKKNIPNKIKPIKLTEPNLQNQTYETKPILPNKYIKLN